LCVELTSLVLFFCNCKIWEQTFDTEQQCFYQVMLCLSVSSQQLDFNKLAISMRVILEKAESTSSQLTGNSLSVLAVLLLNFLQFLISISFIFIFLPSSCYQLHAFKQCEDWIVIVNFFNCMDYRRFLNNLEIVKMYNVKCSFSSLLWKLI